MTNQSRSFEIPSVVVFSLGLLIQGCQIILSSMVGPCISSAVNVDWIAIGEGNWCPLWSHCQIFEASFHIWKMIMGILALFNYIPKFMFFSWISISRGCQYSCLSNCWVIMNIVTTLIILCQQLMNSLGFQTCNPSFLVFRWNDTT